MTDSLTPVTKKQLCPHISSLGLSYFKLHVWNRITPSIQENERVLLKNL